MRASNNSWAKFLQSSYFPVRFTIAVKYISYAPSSIKRDTVNSVMCYKIESLRDSSRCRARTENWNYIYLRTAARIDGGRKNPPSRK